MSEALASAKIGSEDLSTAGSYLSVYRLSRGGMGQVEVAIRAEGAFERLYAVKRLHSHLRDDAKLRRLFLQEARYAGLIRHSHVVAVVDVGEDSDGPYLVMEYIQGLTLSEAVKIDGALPLQSVLRIGAQAARGLHAAHQLKDHQGQALQLVHRDISPQNILLGFDGIVRLTDFGIAKALGTSQQTQTGILKGKFGYMSPEQLRFMPIDHRSDLFALGVVLHELFTGQRLYADEGDNLGPHRILHELPPDLGEILPDAPDSLVELMFALLSKAPAERPSSAAEVAERLEHSLAEVVAEEGVFGLTALVEQNYAQHRQALQERLQEALAIHQSKNELSPTRQVRPIAWVGVGLACLVTTAALAVWMLKRPQTTSSPPVQIEVPAPQKHAISLPQIEYPSPRRVPTRRTHEKVRNKARRRPPVKRKQKPRGMPAIPMLDRIDGQ